MKHPHMLAIHSRHSLYFIRVGITTASVVGIEVVIFAEAFMEFIFA